MNPRDYAIREAYRTEPARTIAARFGLSVCRVRRIGRSEPGQPYQPMTPEDHRRATLEGLRKAKADGRQVGRRRLFADDPAKREEYFTLRYAGYSAREARAAMGLA
jgi:hypothetical protein